MRMLFGYFLIRTPIHNWCVVGWKLKNKHHTNTCLKEIGLPFDIYGTLHNLLWTQPKGPMYSNKKSTNMHFQKSREVRFSIWSLQVFHYRFANETQMWRYKFDQWTMGNMETHLPSIYCAKCICKPKDDSQWRLHLGLWVRLFF